MTLDLLRTRLLALLQGEPLRAIVYGAALVVLIVVHVAVALGYHLFGDVIDFDKALAAATAAAALLTEISRKIVYSPASVARIVANQGPPA